MPHVSYVRVPGQGLDQYRAVNDALGRDPVPGRLAVVAGESDGALHVLTVWTNRSQADRFASERLFPAFVRTGLGPGADASFTTFDTDEIDLARTAATPGTLP
jgi:hypothetical protein